MHRAINILWFSILVSLAACSDSGSPTSGTGMPDTPSNRTIQANPSFASVIQEIFNRNGCTNVACHGSAVSAGLDLRTGSSYASLVGVPATSEPFVRVLPGSPDSSYLVIKLEGRQSVGLRMPQNAQPLDAIDMGNIRNWISQGAQNN